MKYVIVVERGRKSTTVGPYPNIKKAEADCTAWDKTEGRSCWIEPLVSTEDYLKRAAPERVPCPTGS